jgi:demethylmenaquinone methyltransferase/2-methoxy-6-polyprenyl-1,4-benzoquinol methylase
VSVAPKYDRIAFIYELIDLPLEFLIFKKWRKEAISHLKGKILEVGVGTGRNMKYYPPCCSVTGVDNSKGMLEKAKENAKNMKNATFILMDAESLGFLDHSFDYVVTTFVLCTISDPVKALTEMRRVLKPSGEMIALEHMRSQNPIIARFEELIDPILFSLLGDHTTRHTVRNIEEAGFIIKEAKKLFFKEIFWKIRAKP